MSSPLLELSGISKNYHGLRPLRIDRLTLAAGERMAIVGLDGPAAETLTNLITGATLPEHGTVRVFGRATHEIADSAEWLATVDRFGILTARAVLLDGLSVLQNLAVPFTLDIEPPPDDVRVRAEGLAREVDIAPGDIERQVGTVTSGIRARVRLARAVALDPAVLLAEHASAEVTGPEIRDLGRTIGAVASARRLALLAATADEGFAEAMGARVLRLDPATGRLRERRGGWFSR